MMQHIKNRKIIELVLEDYRIADVLKANGINYCCAGTTTLRAACEMQSLDERRLMAELEQSTRDLNLSPDLAFEKWKPGFLLEFIIHVHHDYYRLKLPFLLDNLTSFIWAHSNKHPFLQELMDDFVQLTAAIQAHYKQQEEVIFPYIRQLDATLSGKETYGPLFVRMLRKPLRSTSDDDRRIDILFGKIRTLSSNYQLPAKACPTHRIVYMKLLELDKNWQAHTWMEEKFLFPAAYEIENQLLKA